MESLPNDRLRSIAALATALCSLHFIVLSEFYVICSFA